MHTVRLESYRWYTATVDNVEKDFLELTVTMDAEAFHRTHSISLSEKSETMGEFNPVELFIAQANTPRYPSYYGGTLALLDAPVFDGCDHPGAMAEIHLPRAARRRPRSHVPPEVAAASAPAGQGG